MRPQSPLSKLVYGLAGWMVGASSALLYLQSTTVQGPTSQAPAAQIADKGLVPDHEIMKYGYPSHENVVGRRGYVASPNHALRNPNWVFQKLNTAILEVPKNENVSRENCKFMEDPAVDPMFRPTLGDYVRSGYDRGHMLPARDAKYSAKSMENTFYMTNISPQVGVGFNRHYWERLETHVRNLAKSPEFANLYVATGPLYLHKTEKGGKKYVHYEVIGPNNVAVPTHFYKAILGEAADGKRVQLMAVVLPNEQIPDSVPLETFCTSLYDLEKAAGFKFFDRLPNRHDKSLDACKRLSATFEGKSPYQNK